jgi:hypothetical protein
MKVKENLEDLGVSRKTNDLQEKAGMNWTGGLSAHVWNFGYYYIVTCMSDSRRGFGLDIRFADHLHVVTANN